MPQGLVYDSQPKPVTSRQDWVTPLSQHSRNTRELGPGSESRKWALCLLPAPFKLGEETVKCREQMYLLHLLPPPLSTQGNYRMALPQPLNSFSFNLRKREDCGKRSYKGRVKGTGSDLTSFVLFQPNTNILLHLPRNKGSWDRIAIMLPLPSTWMAIEINISKAPHGGVSQCNWSGEPENSFLIDLLFQEPKGVLFLELWK